jgi:hypothetical protein
VTILAITGAGIAASVFSDLLNLSNPTGLWQMMNLMQLFLLILLFDIYLPSKVLNILNANKYFSLSFSAPFVDMIPYGKPTFSYLNFSSSTSNYSILGVRSGSSLINFLCMAFVLMVIGVLHV